MPEETGLTLDQVRAMAATAGITIGDEFGMMLPLMAQVLAGLTAVSDAALRDVEPLLVHDARRRGPA